MRENANWKLEEVKSSAKYRYVPVLLHHQYSQNTGERSPPKRKKPLGYYIEIERTAKKGRNRERVERIEAR
jgi:hypothetical protein